MYVCVITKGGFPTFEKASLLIKQPIIHLTRTKVNKLSNKNRGTLTREITVTLCFCSLFIHLLLVTLILFHLGFILLLASKKAV